MKTFSKKHRVIIILIIILGFSIPFYANVELFQGNKISNPESINELTLKKAGYWEIGPIKIDDDDPTKNWSVTASTYDWCSGSGLLSDPYIIENVTIDGQNTYNCIHIDNYSG